ncbi:LLM class F420-dependent oxidoreductase [Kribbella yunnanensis]|uniref:LLM class F420-dependent oxidoreductase n=2 Tax=Kribbella yunnanensis TaxID=190194 RepID=A0ABP4UWQ9_9ACTN
MIDDSLSVKKVASIQAHGNHQEDDVYVDHAEYPKSLDDVPQAARDSERIGYDAHWVSETTGDPFVAAAVAATVTSKVGVGTNIAVAFARNPMTVAASASDIHRLSDGRFILGLGTQVKAHITRRFSMPWSHPVARMREFVLAARAIWAHWNDGLPLDFEGEFYRHTLSSPVFMPSPNPHGSPPVFLAGVGKQMTEVAGEVADGFLAHTFTTPQYLRQVTLPALERGRAKRGRDLDDFVVSGVCNVLIDDDHFGRSLAKVKQQIAFYASTPAYRPVLELHGWSDLGEELHRLTVAKRWDSLAEAVDDEVVEAFAVIGTPDSLAQQVADRFGGALDRVTLGIYGEIEPGEREGILNALRAGRHRSR